MTGARGWVVYTLRHDADLSTNTGDCPATGTLLTFMTGVASISGVQLTEWGDVDCSGEINPFDSLKILRADAGLSVNQPSGCPDIGEDVQIAEPAG